jgi:hypothetical protein
MAFVGRKKELKFAVRALTQGRHLFVYGPFGIGKTAFARHVARAVGSPAFRVSLNDTGKSMSEELVRGLTAYEYRKAAREGSRSEKSANVDERIWESDSYSALKGRLRMLPSRRHIVIADDLTKITHPKLSFLRFLIRQNFLLIIPVDSAVAPESLQRVRVVCYNQATLELPRLSLNESLQLADALRQELGIDPDPTQNSAWAKQFHGYPLLIVQRIQQLAKAG